MGLEPLLIPVGFVALLLGSRWMVDGASRLSISLGVRPFVIGLTILAFGSSAPEAALAFTASRDMLGDIVVGNVIGSNIANVGLVVAIAAMICPVKVSFGALRNEVWAMMSFILLITLLAIDGSYSLADSLFLLALIIAFTLLLYLNMLRQPPSEEVRADFGKAIPYRHDRLRNLALILMGLILLLAGAEAIVRGAVDLADMFGVDDLLIGLLVLALGTSLPELSISITAACRRERDLLMSNIVGSNIFNSLFVIGLGASIAPLEVPSAMLRFEYPVMVLLSAMLLIMLRSRGGVERGEALLLLSVFSIYVAVLLAAA